MFRDVIELFLPSRCAVCGSVMASGEKTVCTACRYDAPLTGYAFEATNPVAERFWGIVPIEHACALFFFVQGSGYRDLIHSFKYQGRWRVALAMGEWFGAELKRSGLYNFVDVVIPIPMHPRKRIKRGYNQAEYIARGIASRLDVKVDTRSLVKRVHTSSQARKSEQERLENVRDIFAVRNPEKLKGRNVLLVDDVLTTGATLISASQTLIESVEDIKISIATLATTMKE